MRNKGDLTTLLAAYVNAQNRFHTLKNTVPCGIWTVDEEVTRKIEWYRQHLVNLEDQLVKGGWIK